MPYVEANGIRVHYEERGRGDPMVLIMGLGADGPVWKEHVKAYEKHFLCFLVDNRGAGRTDKPSGPYSTAMMADDIVGLMDALSIGKAHISGISMGGCIAQEIAIRYPERVRSIILNCSWDYCEPYTKRVFENFRSLVASTDPVTFGRNMQLWIFTPEHHNTNMKDLLQREEVGSQNSYPMPIYAFQAQCDACIGHDTREQLNQINAPTLVIGGDKDIFTPIHYSKRVAKAIEGAQLLVFEGCGHTHHWDKLSEYNQKTLEFLLKH